MADLQIERAPGGFQVDGLILQRGKCGCGGMGWRLLLYLLQGEERRQSSGL